MLEGEFTVWAGENSVVLNAGESFLIPPCTPYVVAALSDELTADADIQKTIALAPQHGLTILPPDLASN